MKESILIIPALLLATACFAADAPMVRPADWAQPIVSSTLGNFCRVNDELFRSEQPKVSHIKDLKALGIRSIISLRQYHSDAKEFERAGIVTLHYKMDAGSASIADLVAVLRLIRSAPKPVLVHCWHGSDRTGLVVAGYRMAFMGWPAARAVEELRLGGFGYHAAFYPDIAQMLLKTDVQAFRNAVMGPLPNRPPTPSPRQNKAK